MIISIRSKGASTYNFDAPKQNPSAKSIMVRDTQRPEVHGTSAHGTFACKRSSWVFPEIGNT